MLGNEPDQGHREINSGPRPSRQAPMAASAEIRQQLVTALRRDLIGPAAHGLDRSHEQLGPASLDLVGHRRPGEEVLLE